MIQSEFEKITSGYNDYVKSVLSTAFNFNEWFEQTFTADDEVQMPDDLYLYEDYLHKFLYKCFSFEHWCEQTQGVNFFNMCLIDYKYDENSIVWGNLIEQGLLT